jgi:hypothetical protein
LCYTVGAQLVTSRTASVIVLRPFVGSARCRARSLASRAVQGRRRRRDLRLRANSFAAASGPRRTRRARNCTDSCCRVFVLTISYRGIAVRPFPYDVAMDSAEMLVLGSFKRVLGLEDSSLNEATRAMPCDTRNGAVLETGHGDCIDTVQRTGCRNG